MSAKDKPVSMPATDEYRDNYDRIFNKAQEGLIEEATKNVNSAIVTSLEKNKKEAEKMSRCGVLCGCSD